MLNSHEELDRNCVYFDTYCQIFGSVYIYFTQTLSWGPCKKKRTIFTQWVHQLWQWGHLWQCLKRFLLPRVRCSPWWDFQPLFPYLNVQTNNDNHHEKSIRKKVILTEKLSRKNHWCRNKLRFFEYKVAWSKICTLDQIFYFFTRTSILRYS